MSTPQRVYVEAFEGPRCCNELIPVPAWWILRMGREVPGLSASVRGKASLIGSRITDEQARALFDPPELAGVYYCRACSTALEDVRDAVEDLWNDTRAAIGVVLQAIAAVVVFVPGVGSAVGSVLAGAGALAAGKTLSEAALDAAAGAIPGGILAKTAFEAGREAGGALLDGKPLDEIALAAGRGVARANAGALGEAAYDAALILARGKALQDAGFAVLKSFAKGNDLAERSIDYAEKIARAAQEGRDLQELLIEELGDELGDAAGALAREQLDPVLSLVVGDRSLREMGSGELAAWTGVAEPVARAAQAIARNGAPDEALKERLLSTAAQRAIAKYGGAALEKVQSITDAAAAHRAALLVMALQADPAMRFTKAPAPIRVDALRADPAMLFSAGKAKPAPAIVATTAPPPSSPTSTAAQIVIGLSVAAVLGGLYVLVDGRRT